MRSRREIEAVLDLAEESADELPAERRHLIGFLADHRPDEAVRLASIDLESRNDVYSHGWLAWSLLQAGDVAMAVDAIGPALVESTENALLRYQAGAVHAAAGNDALAGELLERVLDLNDRFDVVHAGRARALLDALS